MLYIQIYIFFSASCTESRVTPHFNYTVLNSRPVLPYVKEHSVWHPRIRAGILGLKEGCLANQQATNIFTTLI